MGTQWDRMHGWGQLHIIKGRWPVPELLTCTVVEPVVRSKDKHNQHLHHHLLHSGKDNFSSDPGRLCLCVWGWPVVLKAALYQVWPGLLSPTEADCGFNRDNWSCSQYLLLPFPRERGQFEATFEVWTSTWDFSLQQKPSRGGDSTCSVCSSLF